MSDSQGGGVARTRSRHAARNVMSAAGWLADAWSDLAWAGREAEAREVRAMQERCDEIAESIEAELRRPIDA
jgi:hypothetical protein